MDRRKFLGTVITSIGLVYAASPALALTESSARKLVDALVFDINRIISSGKSERSMYSDFEKVLSRYGDMSTIAQSTLGPDGRSASSTVKRAYQSALQGYIARKYGKRFRQFIGGAIAVDGVKKVNRYFEVNCTARLRGQSPFAVDFMVSDRSGKELFFDMKIEGVSLLLTERREIGALLDRRRGDIAALTADLKTLG
ncbi:MAG: ABC transporter substrate-binding protein [Marinovum sp.]|nr:ABC transporter substrate-binding protein [Marinovum sp.]